MFCFIYLIMWFAIMYDCQDGSKSMIQQAAWADHEYPGTPYSPFLSRKVGLPEHHIVHEKL